ncbi:hypothetical protein M419DRAFT_7457 [Trichoderma reesei RUT C-30]|uniref:DUF676 domain-containing protein n=1 Tax=Hypocrea jecorina (strain ATCC 56765 / BCRC 32924 / NRRL 11460 / Rut C-30) TaxID=1344414 RepID=A0A024SEN1_HYPJR|nr:hypothetical protein M419DRAFT_7457 [Trichoderma reesei RUT C-30]
MPMIFSEHMEHYDLETIFPYRSDVIPPYERIEVDIITVHCLNIEAKYFVHKNTWSYSSKLWPRDVLPSCYQKRCRVMLFSWNDGLAVTEEDSRFVKHGDHLLRLLMENRLEDPTRPIVFLCHGVGGLIVKEALAKAHLDKTGTIHIIDQCTRMLAFFNTPHHNVAKSVRNIASAAVNPTAPDVLDKLDKACEEHVERMAPVEARGRLYRRRVIINFHGTSIYRGTGMVLVEKEDTKFNARAEYWEKYFPIYGDHTSMCRYRGSEDLTGETVLKIIGLNTRLALRMFPTMDIINRPRFRF